MPNLPYIPSATSVLMFCTTPFIPSYCPLTVMCYSPYCFYNACCSVLIWCESACSAAVFAIYCVGQVYCWFATLHVFFWCFYSYLLLLTVISNPAMSVSITCYICKCRLIHPVFYAYCYVSCNSFSARSICNYPVLCCLFACCVVLSVCTRCLLKCVMSFTLSFFYFTPLPHP